MREPVFVVHSEEGGVDLPTLFLKWSPRRTSHFYVMKDGSYVSLDNAGEVIADTRGLHPNEAVSQSELCACGPTTGCNDPSPHCYWCGANRESVIRAMELAPELYGIAMPSGIIIPCCQNEEDRIRRYKSGDRSPFRRAARLFTKAKQRLQRRIEGEL